MILIINNFDYRFDVNNISVHNIFNFSLPPEVSLLILANLNPKDLIVCSAVSKGFQMLSNDGVLWKLMALKKEILFSDDRSIKQQMKEHYLQFTQLFRMVFPTLDLPKNKLEQFDVLKAHLETFSQDQLKAVIQDRLDASFEIASPEAVSMLIQAGAEVKEMALSRLIKKIKTYAAQDNPFGMRLCKFALLNLAQREDFKRCLQILDVVIKRGGKVRNSKDKQSLVHIALKYKFYELTKNILKSHIHAVLGNANSNEILSTVLKNNQFNPTDIPHIKEIIEMLLSAGAEPPACFDETLEQIGIDPKSLNITKRKISRGSARL